MNRNPRFLGAIVFSVAGMVLLGVVLPSVNDAEFRTLRTAELAYPVPAVEVRTTASELARVYQENPLAADTKFKGRTFEVKGAIDYLDYGPRESIDVVLRAGFPYRNPRFRLDPSERSAAFWLGKGMYVSLNCLGDGVDAGVASSRNCVIGR
ncbi:OB-fold protein [Variovorax sp. RHLX14]|uniref:OB-fold protein n=1 Tax=Variovorax sp. RHLX14 TaxID=1259731 RepID=UPI003F446D40